MLPVQELTATPRKRGSGKHTLSPRQRSAIVQAAPSVLKTYSDYTKSLYPDLPDQLWADVDRIQAIEDDSERVTASKPIVLWLAAVGVSMTGICRILDKHITTVRAWMERDAEFSNEVLLHVLAATEWVYDQERSAITKRDTVARIVRMKRLGVYVDRGNDKPSEPKALNPYDSATDEELGIVPSST